MWLTDGMFVRAIPSPALRLDDVMLQIWGRNWGFWKIKMRQIFARLSLAYNARCDAHGASLRSFETLREKPENPRRSYELKNEKIIIA